MNENSLLSRTKNNKENKPTQAGKKITKEGLSKFFEDLDESSSGDMELVNVCDEKEETRCFENVEKVRQPKIASSSH